MQPPSYTWLSDSDLLLIERIDFNEWNIERKNVITGKKQILPTLINQIHNSFGLFLGQFAPSPNFKWLLWTTSGTDTSMLWGTAMDASHLFGPVFERMYIGKILWLDDSHWIEVQNYPLYAPPEITTIRARQYSADEPDTGLPVKMATPSEKGRLDLWSMRLTSDRHLIAHPQIRSEQETTKIVVFKLSLDSEREVPQQSIVSLSPGAHIYETAFSPQGDRLAWLTSPDKGHVASLWVGRIDGSQIRKLGSLPLSAPLDQYAAGNQFQQVTWTPDGKYLSFIYKDGLYKIPVD